MIFAQVPTNQGRRGEGKALCDGILKKKRGQLEGKLTIEERSSRKIVGPILLCFLAGSGVSFFYGIRALIRARGGGARNNT